MSDTTQRRLSAIVSADVVGYSRLMGADERGTHARLKGRFDSTISPLINTHGGRLVKLMGDGLLVEFPSAVNAVEWALASQDLTGALNRDEPELPEILYRVGINLGDVIVDGDDIFGDGVNIAARLQEMADPGGICISAKVHGEVSGKLNVDFIDGGMESAKNIVQPIHVWRWYKGRKINEILRGEETGEALALPEKPSVAVLPFENMSGDPEQEYFVDGMVEDLLTTLSKIPSLFVIARNSSFVYKGKSVDVRDVGRELGVRHVVEGSVRKAGNRVRVTAQLVDCNDGKHVWAERYDGELDDVFELQDHITREIVTALEVNLTDGDQAKVWRLRSGSPLVYEKFIKGQHHYLSFSKQTHSQARHQLEGALEINETYTPAMVTLGWTLVDQARFGWVAERKATFSAALELGARALEIDPDFGIAHTVISYANTFLRYHEVAVEAADKAVKLSPNDASAFHMSAMSHILAGNYHTGRDYELQHVRLSPLVREVAYVEISRAQFHLGDFDEARIKSEIALKTMPRWLTAQTILLASLWRLRRIDEAKKIAENIKSGHPNFSVSRWASGWPYRIEKDLDNLMEPLLESGLAE